MRDIEIPEGVELPDPTNSIEHEDVAPIQEIYYDDTTESTSERSK